MDVGGPGGRDIAPPPEGVIWGVLGPLKEMHNLKFESYVLFGEQC